MNQMQNGMAARRRCLARAANALNAAGVRWGLGASMLLYVHGIVDRANDIDLVIDVADAARAEAVLSALGERRAWEPNPAYATPWFREVQIDGVEVDAMADMTIRLGGGGVYAYALPAGPLAVVRVDGADIPLCPMEDWYVLYTLMQGREAKLRLLEAHFAEHGVNRESVARLLDDPRLPDVARAALLRLSEGNARGDR